MPIDKKGQPYNCIGKCAWCGAINQELDEIGVGNCCWNAHPKEIVKTIYKTSSGIKKVKGRSKRVNSRNIKKKGRKLNKKQKKLI